VRRQSQMGIRDRNELVKIKICGVTAPEQAAAAAEAGADFIGLVFAEQSRRHVSVHQARVVLSGLPARAPGPGQRVELAAGARPPVRWFDHSAAFLGERLQRKRPLVVGVFADMPATMVNAIADKAGLDLVQLSGHEPWEEALAIRRPVIKAVRVGPFARPAAVLAQAEVGTASLCLLDSAAGGALGGTGAGTGSSLLQALHPGSESAAATGTANAPAMNVARNAAVVPSAIC